MVALQKVPQGARYARNRSGLLAPEVDRDDPVGREGIFRGLIQHFDIPSLLPAELVRLLERDLPRAGPCSASRRRICRNLVGIRASLEDAGLPGTRRNDQSNDQEQDSIHSMWVLSKTRSGQLLRLVVQ